MIIGVPKEIKNNEYRVGLIPDSVKDLTLANHNVIVQEGAGLGVGYSDQDYADAGAEVVSKDCVFAHSNLIVKVKEPQLNEINLLNKDQILFTYLHLAPDLKQTNQLIDSQACCIAYETITDRYNNLPLLAPMSEIAGRMSIQAGAQALEKVSGGSGVLLGGVPGVSSGKVVILGAGTVGLNAAKMAVGLGADVTVLDINLNLLRKIDNIFGSRVKCLYSNYSSITNLVADADLVIGGVLIPGAAAPKLVTEDHIKSMKEGSAVVDVAIDQGGCFETSVATTHENPTYVKHGVIHYCVANIPGAVAKTSTHALNNATMPYILKLANHGIAALKSDEGFLKGLNVFNGHVTCKEVAESLGLSYTDPLSLI